MNQQEIEDLNSLLEEELAATASYKKALGNIKDKKISDVLDNCCASHGTRAEILHAAIADLGGTPTTKVSVWGNLMKVITAGAGTLNDTAVLAALEEGEDLRSNNYEWRLVSMHDGNRTLVRDRLLPEQKATHQRLSQLTNTAGV